MFHIFSDTKVLNEIRAALTPFLKIEEKITGTVTYELDVGRVREIPILRSTMQEALRHCANGTRTRIVLEDIMLNDGYLLKKAAFLFMPNRSYHFDASICGSNVDEFDARRFIIFKPLDSAFREFGGGLERCAGRFFATNAVLTLCAVLAVRFDVEPAGGMRINPGVDDRDMALMVQQPRAKKFLVKFIPRAG